MAKMIFQPTRLVHYSGGHDSTDTKCYLKVRERIPMEMDTKFMASLIGNDRDSFDP